MASFVPSADRVPILQEVEQFRRETESLYMRYRFRATLDGIRRMNVERGCYPDLFTYKSLVLETSAAEMSAELHFERNLRELARMSCRRLTNKVTTVLPREVRDIIYAYILNRTEYPGSSAVPVWNFPNDLDVAPRDITDPMFPPQVCVRVLEKPKHAQCWKKESSGALFVQELIETCYRQTKFEFTQGRLYLLPTFLGLHHPPPFNGDPADIVLPFEHVSKLQFYLSDCVHDVECTSSALQCLRQLKRKSKIELFIETQEPPRHKERWSRKAAEMVELLGPLFPLLDDICQKHQITLRFATFKDLLRAKESDWDEFRNFRSLEISFQNMIHWGLCDEETAARLYGIELIKLTPSKDQGTEAPKAD